MVLLKLPSLSRERMEYFSHFLANVTVQIIQEEILVIFENLLDLLPLMSVS